MIYDSLDHLSRYSLSERFQKAFEFLKTDAFAHMKAGEKVIIEENTITCSVMEKDITEPCTVWENHKRFADIHVVLQGCEAFRMAEESSCTIKTPYDAEKDGQFFNLIGGEKTEILLHEGHFTIQYPGEIHQPNNVIGKMPAHLKKAVLKVRVD